MTTITIDRALLEQALDDLKDLHTNHNITYAGTIWRLEAALAQEQAEPVAWMYTGIMSNGIKHGPHLIWKPESMDAMSASKGVKATPLYTAPPKLVPLTQEEIIDATEHIDTSRNGYFIDIARAVERKLEEKNNAKV